MSYTIRFSPDALTDYSDIHDWYEEKSLEEKFEKEVNERLKFIALYPEASGFKYRHLRGTRLKKFPYRILFELDESLQIATIVAILHDARNSEILEKRFG